jgi:acyl-CoA thioesterase II
MTVFPRTSDLELLGLEFDEDARRGRFTLVPAVARHDGALYGGTAIAVSVTAMETATGRDALWVTTQYVASAQQGDVIDCTTDVLASGRNISQVQVTGRLGDTVLFVSSGSTATPREGGFEGQFQQMPRVAPPEAAEPMVLGPRRPDGFRGFTEQVEYRLAEVLEPAEAAPHLALWVRMRGDRPFTPAGIAFVADMVPGAIARAKGLIGGGASLDNSLRFGRVTAEEEWVLLELRGHMAVGAHAHGSVWVWTRDGALVAVGGQSANMNHAFTQEEIDSMMASGEQG